MALTVRALEQNDFTAAINIWNNIVERGDAFPQSVKLTPETGQRFFNDQTHVGIAEYDGQVAGLYILHPNNVGHCAHVSNASYAVDENFRGKGIGRALVEDSLKVAKAEGFKMMQFNAVVATNTAALALYKKLGFQEIGRIPNGFKLDNGTYVDTFSMYKSL